MSTHPTVIARRRSHVDVAIRARKFRHASRFFDGDIPAYLPRSMYDIHVFHDYDASKIILLFSLTPEEMTAFQEGLASLGFERVERFSEQELDSALLTIFKKPKLLPNFDDPGYEFHIAEMSQSYVPGLLAVHAESGRIYHWHP